MRSPLVIRAAPVLGCCVVIAQALSTWPITRPASFGNLPILRDSEFAYSQKPCLRLVRALCVETHETWLEDNRYLNMELLKEQCRERLRAAS